MWRFTRHFIERFPSLIIMTTLLFTETLGLGCIRSLNPQTWWYHFGVRPINFRQAPLIIRAVAASSQSFITQCIASCQVMMQKFLVVRFWWYITVIPWTIIGLATIFLPQYRSQSKVGGFGSTLVKATVNWEDIVRVHLLLFRNSGSFIYPSLPMSYWWDTKNRGSHFYLVFKQREVKEPTRG